MHTLVASTVTRSTDAVLLVKEGKEGVQGLWNLPGGRVEADENPFDTAVRELEEEVGASVELSGLVGVYLGVDDFVDGPFIAITYLGQLTGTPRAVPSDTVEAIDWVDSDALTDRELRSPYVSQAIQDASERTYPLDIVQSFTQL
jgi:8-oxo-dGTP diphosphatase